MHLRRASALLVLALVALLVPASPPAFAAISRVGVVTFAHASTTSLTLSWPKTSGARGYLVWKSIHKNMAYRTNARAVSSSYAKVSGLKPGETYCFQVQGKAGTKLGQRSAVTCHPTIREQGPIAGPAYKVMSFNACSDVCSNWSGRSAAAREMIRVRAPDVIAAQESGNWSTPPPGYRLAVSKSAKRIFYKTSRFALVSNSSGVRAGEILMRAPNKYAVWAELVDQDTGKRMIFVSAHTSPAFADYPERAQEIQTLMSRINQLNTAGLAVMYAGDFNSHKNRGEYSESAGFGSQDSVGRTFAAAGYYDSYDLASHLKRNNWNSYGGWSTTPKRSIVWGDHVDHVYVKPSRSYVYQWMNAALYSGSRYTSPIPSDHRPVMAQLYVN
jgi:endonuclease/exonuclease/phosphatase family metal-dependent hydrolase